MVVGGDINKAKTTIIGGNVVQSLYHLNGIATLCSHRQPTRKEINGIFETTLITSMNTKFTKRRSLTNHVTLRLKTVSKTKERLRGFT